MDESIAAITRLRIGLARSRARARQLAASRRWLQLLLLHAPLAMAIKASALVATIHALCTLVFGLRCLRARSPASILYVMGYIIASEPLWRVGRAMLFYETAKYAVAGFSILALLRYRSLNKPDPGALLYFMLLLPSFFVLPDFDRRAISFNISGPFALATSAFFLSTLRIPGSVLRKLFLAILLPTFGFAFVASYSTYTTEYVDFLRSKTAAGGLGNNQASSALGLGVLIAFAYICIARRPPYLRWCVAAVGLWCGIQGALTFSRGGVATAVGAMAVISVLLLRDRRFRGIIVVRVALILLIATFVAVPFLDNVTSGGFKSRFTDTDLTGRDKIIESDMIAFQENPILGVGPGQSKKYHESTHLKRYSSHTEYSRLLAEHGYFGLTALALLAWMAFKRLIRSSAHIGTALAAGFTIWSLLFMFHAAMRMASASFIFGLGAAYLMTGERTPPRPLRGTGQGRYPRPPPNGPGHKPVPVRSPAVSPSSQRYRTRPPPASS